MYEDDSKGWNISVEAIVLWKFREIRSFATFKLTPHPSVCATQQTIILCRPSCCIWLLFRSSKTAYIWHIIRCNTNSMFKNHRAQRWNFYCLVFTTEHGFHIWETTFSLGKFCWSQRWKRNAIFKKKIKEIVCYSRCLHREATIC